MIILHFGSLGTTTRLYTVIMLFFFTGDKVYYKRITHDIWNGPAVVPGQDGQVLVKHRDIYIRVHTCRSILEKPIPLK